MTEERREALRAYFKSVVRDLLLRGAIKRQRGQTLDSILRTEWNTVLNEVREDFIAIGKEIGMGLLEGGVKMLVGAAMRALGEMGRAGRK